MQHRQAWCPQCQALRLCIRDARRPPEGLYLILTIITCGLWLIVWALDATIIGLRQPPFRCSQCGQEVDIPGEASIAGHLVAGLRWIDRGILELTGENRWGLAWLCRGVLMVGLLSAMILAVNLLPRLWK